jgi:hypothetical protein
MVPIANILTILNKFASTFLALGKNFFVSLAVFACFYACRVLRKFGRATAFGLAKRYAMVHASLHYNNFIASACRDMFIRKGKLFSSCRRGAGS